MKIARTGILTAIFMGVAAMNAAPVIAQSMYAASTNDFESALRDNITAPEFSTFIGSLVPMTDSETATALYYTREFLRKRPDLAAEAIKAMPQLVWSNTKTTAAEHISLILEMLIEQDSVTNTRLINETWQPFASAMLHDAQPKTGAEFYYRFYMYSLLTNVTPELQTQKAGELWGNPPEI